MLYRKAFTTAATIAILSGSIFGQTDNWLCSGSEGWPNSENALVLAPDTDGDLNSLESDHPDPNAAGSSTDSQIDPDPCYNKYCMSVFTKTRTSKTVGKGRLSVALKYQFMDYDDKKGSDDRYHDLASDNYSKHKAVLTLKYGWADNHHLGICAPYMWNDFDVSGKRNDSQDFGNIALFEKWNLIKESRYIPGVAVDAWFYLPTGNTDRKLGSSDYSWRFTAEISKAWPDFSIHLNPGYVFTKERSADAVEFNAALILTPCKTLWPALEYNFEHNESKGFKHDIVPGIIYRFAPGWSFKVGAVINLDSSQTYRDDLGVVAKLFYCCPLHK